MNGGGGGGGGLYGGGGGGTEFQWTTRPLGAAHGGGGSSFGPTGTSFRGGVWGNLGDGSLTISYDPAEDALHQGRAARTGERVGSRRDLPAMRPARFERATSASAGQRSIP